MAERLYTGTETTEGGTGGDTGEAGSTSGQGGDTQQTPPRRKCS